jgi:chromosomal replication initiation ATPase DnaA
VGAAGAGKSHLAAVWAQETGAAILPAAELPAADPAALAARGAVALEDADRALTPEAERALFHLHERLSAARGALLLTSREAPGRWPVALPDLATRLAAISVARLERPDDALREALVVKLFADRGLAAAPGVPRLLAERAPRSHAALSRAVDEIDRAALAGRRRASLTLAREVLSRLDVAD